MKELDMAKDILYYRINNQKFYNDNLITIRNPEVRQLFTQMRDDEMRAIVDLQQMVKRLESPSTIIQKIFPMRTK